MARERARLQTESVSPQDVARMLGELKTRLEAESGAELEELRKETAAVLADQRRQIVGQSTEVRSALVRVSQERAAIAAEPGASPPAGALQEPESSEAQKRELVVSSAVASAYAMIVDKLAVGDYHSALARLQGLKTLLIDPSLVDLPSVAIRRAADLAILRLLQEYTEAMLRPAAGGGGPDSAPSAVAAEPDRPRPAAAAADVGPPPAVAANRPPASEAAAPTPVPVPARTGRIVGRVALVQEGTVVVETLTAFPVIRGATLEIRRADVSGTLRPVCTVLVTEVSGNRVVAAGTRGGASPAVMDQAYLIGQ